jgi:radical SAM superfamily enzyme YgiQ (UPF0313 family)
MEELVFLDRKLSLGSWVHFFDTIFTFPRERASRICDLLAQHTRNLYFSCDIKANHITPDLAAKLHNARFRFISMGFDTADNSPLRMSGKGNTFDDCQRSMKILRTHCPRTALKAYWLFGLPGSDSKTCETDVDLIQHLLRTRVVDIVGPKLFVPYPETPYYKTPEAYSLKIWSHEWSCYDRFHLPPVSTPSCYTQDELGAFLKAAEGKILSEYCGRLAMPEDRLRLTPHVPRRYNGDLYSRMIP